MVMSDICIESVPTYESLFLGFLILYKVLTELCLFTRIFVNDDQGHNALNRAGPWNIPRPIVNCVTMNMSN